MMIQNVDVVLFVRSVNGANFLEMETEIDNITRHLSLLEIVFLLLLVIFRFCVAMFV
jgi:hypothetical protein